MNPQSLQDPHAEKSSTKPDASLMVLIGEFHEAHAQAKAASEKCCTEQDRVKALPDCPPSVTPRESQEGYERHEAFFTEHGVIALYDQSNKYWRLTGALANRISATPAHTLGGVFEKLKIVRLALGDVAHGGDENLDAYQTDSDEPWFTSVMRDFDRLTQPASSTPDDPFPEWLAEWEAALIILNRAHDPFDEDAVKAAYERINPIQADIIKRSTRTIAGVVAKLRMLVYYDEELGSEIPDNLANTALAGAEHIMSGPGVVTESKDAAAQGATS